MNNGNGCCNGYACGCGDVLDIYLQTMIVVVTKKLLKKRK